MRASERASEGLFLKLFVSWLLLAILWYLWAYLRSGRFIGSEDEKEE